MCWDLNHYHYSSTIIIIQKLYIYYIVYIYTKNVNYTKMYTFHSKKSCGFLSLWLVLSYTPSRNPMTSVLKCWWSLFSCSSSESLMISSPNLKCRSEYRSSFHLYHLALVNWTNDAHFGNVDLATLIRVFRTSQYLSSISPDPSDDSLVETSIVTVVQLGSSIN